MDFIWPIIIGFVAGIIAKFFIPARNESSGFATTTLLGVIGAVFGYLGQAVGWYTLGDGLISAIVGAIIVLAVWGFIVKLRAV